jgi:ABC-type branched-subunit amino acid transport system substrate-binding protein
MNLRRALAIFCAALLALVLSACGSSGSDESSSGNYKFDLVSNFTGPVGTVQGIPMIMLQAYIKKVNADGGVNGKEISLNQTDAAADVQKAVVGVRSAASDSSVLAVLGLGVSAQMESETPLLNSSELAGIATPGGRTEATPYVWTMGVNFRLMSIDAAKFVLAKSASPKVATIGIDLPDTRLADKVIQHEIQAGGGTRVGAQFLPVDQQDATAAVKSLVSQHPDWLVVTGVLGGQNTSILQAMKLYAPKTPIIFASNGCATSVMAAADVDNLYAACPALPPQTSYGPTSSTVRDIAKQYGGDKAISGVDDSYATMGYELGRALVAALKSCSSPCDRKAFHSALGSVKLPGDGLVAGLDFTKPDHTAYTGSAIVKWDSAKGQQIIVQPFQSQ